MSLINRIINAHSTEWFKISQKLLRADPGSPFVTDFNKRLVFFIAAAAATKRHHSLHDSIDQAIRDMKTPTDFSNLWPFMTPSQAVWYEWEPKEEKKVMTVGVLITPLKDQQGFSSIIATSLSTDTLGFGIYPELQFGEKIDKTYVKGKTYGLESYDDSDREPMLEYASMISAGMSNLMLLMNSESSPIVIKPAVEDFLQLNKKREREGKLALRSLQPIAIDISKFGAEERQQIKDAGNDPERIKRICVEHLVHSHFKTIKVGKPPMPKLYRIGQYKRYEGSPKGSIVDQPREVIVKRSNPNSPQKLRGPGGIDLL